MPPWVVILFEVVFPTIAAIVVATWRITRSLGRLDARLANIEVRIATLESQNRALLKAFPQVISSLIAGHLMTAEQGTQLIATALEVAPIAEILTKIQPTLNPLSQADVDRLRNYVERLKQGAQLTVQETHDFYRLSDIITREYPSNEGSWLLFLVAGILLGALITGSKK